MFGGPHFYETLSLTTVGVVVGLYLVISHVFAYLKAEQVIGTLKTIHRSRTPGVVLLVISMVWFWLLVAPDNWGVLSKLTMDLGEFDKAKPILQLATPIAAFLVATHVREFLFVRALGLLVLLIASPLLEAAFLKEPASRVLLSFFAYILIIKGLYWVGMPYLFRDAVTWVTANTQRFKNFALAGAIYGGLILICAVLFWRGH